MDLSMSGHGISVCTVCMCTLYPTWSNGRITVPGYLHNMKMGSGEPVVVTKRSNRLTRAPIGRSRLVLTSYWLGER